MFYSHEILARKTPLGLIWTLAHGKKLAKNKIISIDIRELCKDILEPSVPFALRLQGILINGIVCVYAHKQAYLLRDLQDMRKRIESAGDAPAGADGTDADLDADAGAAAGGGGGGGAGGGRKRGAATLKQGKDRAALEAITMMHLDGGSALAAADGGLFLAAADFGGARGASDFASELFELPSLGASLTASRSAFTKSSDGVLAAAAAAAAGSRKRHKGGGGGMGAAAGAHDELAAELFMVEGVDADEGGPVPNDDMLLAMHQADEVFDAPLPDVDVFGGDFDALAAPMLCAAGDGDGGGGGGASPLPECEPSEGGAAAEAAAAAARGRPAAAAGSKKRGAKRRAHAPIVDRAAALQINHATYRGWLADVSRVTTVRPLRAGGGADGSEPGLLPSPAKNNAAAAAGAPATAGAAQQGMQPASAFAGGGLLGLAGGRGCVWGAATLAAFALCAGSGVAAGRAADAAAGAAGAGGFPLAPGGGFSRAARTPRGLFGELPFEEPAYGDDEHLAPLQGGGFDDFDRDERRDALGDLAGFGDGDLEAERLRAGAPTPGGSGDGAAGAAGTFGQRGSFGSSLGGGAGRQRGVKGGPQPSGSDTSLLAPESAFRASLRAAAGRKRGASLAGLLDEGEGDEAGSGFGRGGGRRRRATGGSLRDLLPDVDDGGASYSEQQQQLLLESGGCGTGPGTGTLPSSQWPLLEETATQHDGAAPARGPEHSMTAATSTAVRVFRASLLEAARRGEGSVSFLAIAARLARAEAAKAFYQVCVTHANGFVKVGQAAPYGDIRLAAGPRM